MTADYSEPDGSLVADLRETVPAELFTVAFDRLRDADKPITRQLLLETLQAMKQRQAELFNHSGVERWRVSVDWFHIIASALLAQEWGDEKLPHPYCAGAEQWVVFAELARLCGAAESFHFISEIASDDGLIDCPRFEVLELLLSYETPAAP